MDRFDYYNELYYKELDNRNEINNSLSLPIGLITALVAGLFYLLTSFDYSYSIVVAAVFILFLIFSVLYLGFAIFYLIKAYCNITKGYDYSMLADANVVDAYYWQLKEYYAANITAEGTAEDEFRNYLVSEMVKNTDDNQKNNKTKSKYRYNCEKYLIISFMFLCVSIPFFTTDYIFKKAQKENTDLKIVAPEPIKVNLNLPSNRNFIKQILNDTLHAPEYNSSKTDSTSKPGNKRGF